jgi:hypothetical protein
MVYGHGGRVSQRRPTGGSHSQSPPGQTAAPRSDVSHPTDTLRSPLLTGPTRPAQWPAGSRRGPPFLSPDASVTPAPVRSRADGCR